MRIFGERNERTVTAMPTGGSATTAASALAAVGNETTNQREWLEERWRLEDERWERFAVTGEVTHALDMLGNPVPTHRLIAARRMPELAETRIANGPVTRSTEGYPYFTTISIGLAAALAVEEHLEVRGAIRDSVSAMVGFAAEGEQQLLYAVIPHLADANRAALRAFKATLCRFLAKFGGDERAIAPLVSFLSLTPRKEDTLQCLLSLIDEADSSAARDRLAALRTAQATIGEPAAAANNNLLDNLYSHACRLTECRDALAEALRLIHAPPQGITNSLDEFEKWRHQRRLYLYSVFLAGARLSNAHLSGAILPNAYLHGANLEGANLISTDLKEARLAGAELYGVLLRSENGPLRRADLRSADWWKANTSSWRGNGQNNQEWLASTFPQPLQAEEPISLVRDTEETIPSAAFPTVAEPVYAGAPMSAADKIAELKRRRTEPAVVAESPVPTPEPIAPAPTMSAPVLPSVPSAPPVPSPWSDEPISDEGPAISIKRPVGRKVGKISDLALSAGSVAIRESPLPKENDRMSPRDLNAVTDLMGDRYTPVKAAKVAIRESGLPKNSGVTEGDLSEITDLMTDR
jgi:hypothetical protein